MRRWRRRHRSALVGPLQGLLCLSFGVGPLGGRPGSGKGTAEAARRCHRGLSRRRPMAGGRPGDGEDGRPWDRWTGSQAGPRRAADVSRGDGAQKVAPERRGTKIFITGQRIPLDGNEGPNYSKEG